MGERKVDNKYYPPDFDPWKIPRRKSKNQQMNVRSMLPMSIRCNTCGAYIGKGTKFNHRKEDVINETYLGIVHKFRFYFKCTNCSAEIVYKTDPKNSDYELESGASRNSEPWRNEDEIVDKSFEKRILDSKREMDNVANVDELMSMKSRHAKVKPDSILEALDLKEFEKEDETLLKEVNFHGFHNYVHRINDEELDDNVGVKRQKLMVKISVVSKKKGCEKAESCNKEKQEDNKDVGSSGLIFLCSSYDSNDED